MALTNAERQAALKARREEMTRMLAEQNAALLAENAELRAEVATLRESPPPRSGEPESPAQAGSRSKDFTEDRSR